MDYLKLKEDLLEYLKTQKYYQELELVRLVNNDILYRYEVRIEKISDILGKISALNRTIDLLDVYFMDPEEENLKED